MARSSRTVQGALNEMQRLNVLSCGDVALLVVAMTTALAALSTLIRLDALAYRGNMMGVEAKHQAIRAGADPEEGWNT